jgi:hypothetical protein
METHRDQTFKGKSFVIEEVAFVKCNLIDCDFFYSGGDFDWAECHFEGCRFHWRGPAKNTAMLLQAMGALRGPQTPPQSTMPTADPSHRPN